MSLVELEPVDGVEITILMDNVTDPLLVDQDEPGGLRNSHRRME